MADDGGLYLLQGAFAHVDDGGVFREYESPGSQQRRLAALQAGADAAYAASVAAVNRRLVQHAHDGALEDLHELVEELTPGELLYAFTDSAYRAAACSGRVLVLEYLRRRGYVVRDVATRGSRRGDVCLSIRTGEGLLALPPLEGIPDRLVALEADALEDGDDADGDSDGSDGEAAAGAGGVGLGAGRGGLWDAAAAALDGFRAALAATLQELADATSMPDASTLLEAPPAVVLAPGTTAATAPGAVGAALPPPAPVAGDGGAAAPAAGAGASDGDDSTESDGAPLFSAPTTLAYLVHVGRLPLSLAADPTGTKVATAACCTRPDGYSPLHLAALLGLPHMVAALIVLGCEVNAVAPDGATPLSCALQGKAEHAPLPTAASAAPLRGRGGMRGRGGGRGASRAAGATVAHGTSGSAGAAAATAAAAAPSTGAARLQLSEGTDIVFDDFPAGASAALPAAAAGRPGTTSLQQLLLQSLRAGSTRRVWGNLPAHARFAMCEALLRVAGAEDTAAAAMRSPHVLAKRRFLWLPSLPPTTAPTGSATRSDTGGDAAALLTAAVSAVVASPTAAGAASGTAVRAPSKKVAFVASTTAASMADADHSAPVHAAATANVRDTGDASVRDGAGSTGVAAATSAAGGAVVVTGAPAVSSAGAASAGKTTFSGMFLSREQVWAREMARLQAAADAAAAGAATGGGTADAAAVTGTASGDAPAADASAPAGPANQ